MKNYYNMKIALVCIAKMEDFYINEWVLYHKKLGFDDIIIYENDWNCNLEYEFIKKIKYNGIAKQISVYNDFIENYKTDYNWVAFFDVDEFLVLKKHQNIKVFINEFNNPYGIGVNWVFFGACGRLTRGEHNNSLIKQFTIRQKDVDRHVKTILNLQSNSIMVNPHYPNVNIMNTTKNYFTGPFNENGTDNIAQINHYHHKTFDDWKIRCIRNQADTGIPKKEIDWINTQFDFCDVEDLHALNFMYKN
jgi:hypothetical protein